MRLPASSINRFAYLIVIALAMPQTGGPASGDRREERPRLTWWVDGVATGARAYVPLS